MSVSLLAAHRRIVWPLSHGQLVQLAVLALAACWLTPAAHGAATYRIVALDVLPGGSDSYAFGLNDHGQVVGTSTLDRSGNVGRSRPVVWDSSGVPRELWTDEGVGGVLQDVNNAGEIVGRYGSGSGIPLPGPGVPYGRAFYWSSTVGRHDIGFEPLGFSQAVEINEAGQVAGSSERLELVEIDGTPQPQYVSRGFVWDAAHGIRGLDEPTGKYYFTHATAINNQGQAAGYGGLSSSGQERAFVWDQTHGLKELPTIAGGDTRAVAINDLGQVLGVEFGIGGVVWDLSSGMITQVPGGFDFNNLGQAVGGRNIWDQSLGLRLISDLIPQDTGWQIEFVFAINDKEEIVGYGLLKGELRGFLLIPVPESSKSSLAIVAFTLIACCRSRRPRRP
ncbi:MAG: hypothetical protein JNL18_14920 [Planctomycetaceae bacterium]|nr:hypothetical protein [Planctomycetaceae bacterium]